MFSKNQRGGAQTPPLSRSRGGSQIRFSPRTLCGTRSFGVLLCTSFLAVYFWPDVSPADVFNWNNLVLGGGACTFVSPVENQGAGNTCWAFAATAVLESHYMITRDDPTFSMDLSEQMLISAPGAGSVAQGIATAYGYPDLALIYTVNTGLVTASTLPYLSLTSPTDYSISQDTVNSWANQVCKAANCVIDIQDTTAAIKADLKKYGPMAATLMVDNNFWPPDQQASNISHAVLITGYQDDSSVPGGGYYIVKKQLGHVAEQPESQPAARLLRGPLFVRRHRRQPRRRCLERPGVFHRGAGQRHLERRERNMVGQ